jgi:hypothetical protein
MGRGRGSREERKNKLACKNLVAESALDTRTSS